MLEKDVKELETIAPTATTLHSPARTLSRLAPLFSTIAFVLSILFMAAPLSRIPDPVIQLRTPAGSWLTWAGSWLPANLGFTQNKQASIGDTGYVEFLLLIALAFIIYGLFALFIARQPNEGTSLRVIRRLVWAGALLGGLIFVFTPTMLSHDIIVYTSYSRVLAVYHANPYFVPPSAFPNDPYTPMNYWATSIAAYGPIWILVCGFWGLLVGPQPIAYVLAFRAFALAAHLGNIWLVGKTLHTMGSSKRTITLGMLLYAWSPLALLESSLGGHNDVFMVTFLLLGVLLLARAEKQSILTSPRGYLPAIVMFTLAALVKFTVLPVIALVLAFLAWKALRPSTASIPFMDALRSNWKPAAFVVMYAGIAAAAVTLAFYGPFWIGHNLNAIRASFTTTPSALNAQNSVLRALLMWNYDHHVAAQSLQGRFIHFFSARKLWDELTIVVLGLFCLLGMFWLWKTPTLRTFALASVATLGALLLVTPWFFSWYVTWLIGLVAIAIPVRQSRPGTALFVMAQTLAITSFLTYLYKDGYPPFGTWEGMVFLVTLAPTLLASGLAFILWHPPEIQRRKAGAM